MNKFEPQSSTSEVLRLRVLEIAIDVVREATEQPLDSSVDARGLDALVKKIEDTYQKLLTLTQMPTD